MQTRKKAMSPARQKNIRFPWATFFFPRHRSLPSGCALGKKNSHLGKKKVALEKKNVLLSEGRRTHYSFNFFSCLRQVLQTKKFILIFYTFFIRLTFAPSRRKIAKLTWSMFGSSSKLAIVGGSQTGTGHIENNTAPSMGLNGATRRDSGNSSQTKQQ